jgi:hypothetical protein
MNDAESTLQPEDTVMMEYGYSEPHAIELYPDETSPALLGPAQRLGLLEVLDKNGATVNRLLVTQWPVTVGRALGADVVIDDPHIAPEHLRISALDAGFVQVQVLDTVNGVRRGYGALMQRGMRFDWTGSDDLGLGRLRLRLRLSGTPMAPEQVLPAFAWRPIAIAVALVLALVIETLMDAWFKTTSGAKFTQAAIPAMTMLLGSIALWAGVWALATKLFTGHLQFVRHVRIVCAVLLVDALVSGLAYLLAFMFSWESLARYNGLLSAPVLGAGVFLQLMVIAPQWRKGLMALVTGVVLAVVLVWAGSNWQKNKRVSNQLYLSALFPPSWRLASAVPVDQLVREAKSIEQRLDARLKDAQDDQQDDASDPADEE